MAENRELDFVLFGATGFTGGLTAEYLAEHAPEGTRWALAGRSRERLERVRDRLAQVNPACAALALIEADAADPGSLAELAARSRAVVSTVGPYISYGEPLVAACAAAGTDYLDLTGEPEFVDRMYVGYHAQALETGARLVHCCGFDSIPPDLGVLFTVLQLPEGVPLSLAGYLSVGGRPSGGTLHSALTAMSRARQMASAARERRKLEPRPEGRRVRASRPAPGRTDGGWALPFPTIDPQIVTRSARALERYGPDFSYSHNLAVKRLPTAVGLAAGTGGLLALAQIPPARKWIMGRRSPGQGPSPEERERGFFRLRIVGEGGGARVVTQVSGGDPGYDETARMLGEAALCITADELPDCAGQVTPAVAMGEALIGRLQVAGISFETLERSSSAASSASR